MGSLCPLPRRFHHIKSLTKRKLICSHARDLRLGGACKPGFPGERRAVQGVTGLRFDHCA